MFNPISGILGVLMKSIKTNNDVMHTIYQALIKNPKA